MKREEIDTVNCSVGRTLAIIGDRWTMLVIREAFYRVRRFDQMQRNLGIARNVLADRLQKLVAEGILDRRLYQKRPERFEYHLTPAGLDLYPALVTLLKWGDIYRADTDGPSIKLVHEKCGHDADPTLTCGHCGEQLDPREVRVDAGPGQRRVEAA
jgi:DNA-binding HxlR family transcriptional regulator